MPLLRKIVWLLVFAALVVRVSAADAAAYRTAMAAGQSLLEKGDYAGAFQQFQRALAADSAQTEVYFLLGVASYRQGNLAAAEEYAKQALARTPEAEQPRIQEMLKVIGEKRDFERLVREADEAAGSGLMAKAAESYRKAYLLFSRQGQVGLRAAEIYAGSLNKPLEAAALWQRIQAEDPENAAAAREELVRRRGELNRVIDAQFEAAQKSGNAEALLKLVEVAPERLDLRFELAAVFATRNDAEKAIKHLAEANKLGLKVDALVGRQDFLDLIVSEEHGKPFVTFIDAAFGADAVTAMREKKARADREAKAEAARRAEAEEKAKKEERERERQVWRATVAELTKAICQNISFDFRRAPTDEDDEVRNSITALISNGVLKITSSYSRYFAAGSIINRERGTPLPPIPNGRPEVEEICKMEVALADIADTTITDSSIYYDATFRRRSPRPEFIRLSVAGRGPQTSSRIIHMECNQRSSWFVSYDGPTENLPSGGYTIPLEQWLSVPVHSASQFTADMKKLTALLRDGEPR